MVSTCSCRGDLDVPLGVAQGVFKVAGRWRAGGALHLALLVQLQANVQRLPLQQGAGGVSSRRMMAPPAGAGAHGLLRPSSGEGFGEQRHLSSAAARMRLDGAGCRGGRSFTLPEQGRGSLDHHVGVQLVAASGWNSCSRANPLRYLVLARQQRLRYLSQLRQGRQVPPLIGGEVGDPLAQPLQQPWVTHQRTSQMPKAQQLGARPMRRVTRCSFGLWGRGSRPHRR